MSRSRVLVAATLLASSLAAGTARGQLIFNGDFETNSLSPWTTFTTSNGTIGTPAVVSFDTTGSGASLAAMLAVGQVSFSPGNQEGGGLFQTFSGVAGDYTLSVDVAANKADAGSNGEGGVFTLLFNAAVVDTYAVGNISGNSTARHTLSGTVTGVAAGTQEVRLLVTRPYHSPGTVSQYADNFSVAVAVPEPAPMTIASVAGLILGATWLARRPRPRAMV